MVILKKGQLVRCKVDGPFLPKGTIVPVAEDCEEDRIPTLEVPHPRIRRFLVTGPQYPKHLELVENEDGKG